MRWYVADKGYIEGLRTLDSRVPIVDYGDDLKPFVGVVVIIDNINFYVSVTSPKPKQASWSNKLDFIRVEDEHGKLLAGLNLNNMLPIPNRFLTPLDYMQIHLHRSFISDEEKRLYLELLRDELKDIRKKRTLIERNALKLYNSVMENPETSLAKRTVDFKTLMGEYNKY